MRRLRIDASASPSSASTSSPARRSVPEVGRSRQPRMFISVLLPEPDAPITATNSPSSMSSDTPASACTVCAPMR